MNILYFTLDDFDSLINYHSINTDLLREFQKDGHKVFIISPSERNKGFSTRLIQEKDAIILKPRIGNIQKTNIIEKGISTVTIGKILIREIKKHYKKIKFDLILYCTPPITFLSAINYLKKRDNAKTYLLLKDIFPQNAVDIGLLQKSGIKGFLYRIFRKQEKKLYAVSDHIGCMSPANVRYLIKHNPEVDPKTVEVCPNGIEIVDKSVDFERKKAIRMKYGIPLEKKILVYGGNLGKPQGIPFIINCLKRCAVIEDVFFIIVGDGTEYHLLEEYKNTSRQNNIKLLQRLPKEDYDTLVGACDIGMIFLDHRFTIPNFPSRLLSYMQAKLPVLACTDVNSDIGKVIVDGGFGWWCESNDTSKFYDTIMSIPNDLNRLKENSWKYFSENYSSRRVYEIIMRD